MAISLQGSGSSATTTVTIPAHGIGDMIVIMATGTVAPTAPAAGGTVPTWSSISTGSNNSLGITASYAIATATNHTSGTWTSATHMHVLVFRATRALTLGNVGTFAGANNTYILSPRGANDSDIWKEGLALVKKNAKPASTISTAATNVKNITTALVKAASPADNSIKNNKSSMAQGKPMEALNYTAQKSYKSVKSLHRTQFLHALSSIAFPDKQCVIDNCLINLVPTKGKNHVAIKFLKENGGIWSSKLSLKDKLYLSATNLKG